MSEDHLESNEPVDIDELQHVGGADTIDDGQRVIVEVRGREIAVFNAHGEFYAVANYCVHQGGPVCEGLLSGTLNQDGDEVSYVSDGEIISCPWHGWEFDIKTGEHLARSKYKLPTYDVFVHEDEIYLDL